MKRKRIFPIIDALQGYDRQRLRGDLVAGLTVGVMLIPQGMAYAMLAGLPAIYGLYAATIPLVIYALLGTSRQLAVGPAALLSLLTVASVSKIVKVEQDPELYISLAITLALLVGIIKFLLGVFRLGFMVNFLSHPVVNGFNSAAAFIIGLSQVKHLLGLEVDSTLPFHQVLLQVSTQMGATHLLTLAIGLGSIVLMLGSKKLHRAIPGPLLAVVLGTALVALLHWDQAGVQTVGAVPAGLPTFVLPSFDLTHWQALLPAALAISLVSFMSSIAVGRAMQDRHKDYQLIPNQELLALGTANMLGSFFQSFPVTGGHSRTAVNDEAGANSGVASLLSALLITLTLLFFTQWFYFLPRAVLAAVIMLAVVKLVDWQTPRTLWRTHRTDFWMLAVTFVITLLLGIELGIGLGVLLSLALIIFDTSRPHMAVLGRVPDTRHFRNISRFAAVEQRPDLLIVRFDARLYFANLHHFQTLLNRWILAKGEHLRLVVINAVSMNDLDSSALRMLKDVIEELRCRDIDICFTDVKGPVRDRMAAAGLVELMGKDHFFMSVAQAVDYFDCKPEDRPSLDRGYILQNNTGKKGNSR